MQRSCSVEHAHDAARLSQNFADNCRELSRSVSGMLHCIVRDKLAVFAWRLLPSAVLQSRCFQCGFPIASDPDGHASLRQFATDTARRDKVLRQLVAKMFRLRSKILAHGRRFLTEQAGTLRSRFYATFLSGQPCRKDLISVDRTQPIHSVTLFRWVGCWTSV
jgi:hypothetical protein